MKQNNKISIYVVIDENTRFNKNMQNRITKRYESQFKIIEFTELKNIANEIVDLIIFDNILIKNISYSQIHKIKQNNVHLHSVELTTDMSQKNLYRLAQNHIDYIINANFHDNYIITRLKNILSRKNGKFYIRKIIQYKNIKIDRLINEVFVDDVIVDTTRKELKLLKILFNNKNNFISKKEIFTSIWKYDDEDVSRVLDQYIHRIKKKFPDLEIEVDKKNQSIKLS